MRASSRSIHNLGASATWKSLTFGLSYVDTDGTFVTPNGSNA